jgi:hypothetical protein
MSEVKSMEAFRDALTGLGRQFTQRAFSEEQAADLVLWLAFALLDRERRSWTDEQRTMILQRCIKEMELRLKYGRWPEEWLGWP